MLSPQKSACDRCRALKSRCSRENGAAKCERCQRLQIECIYSPSRPMGRPSKKRSSHDITTQPTPPASYRRCSTISNMTVQTTQSDGSPLNINDHSDFQYDLGLIESRQAGYGGHEWTDNFEDPLLGLQQDHDTKLMSTEWIETDVLGFLDHHKNALAAGSHDMPLTSPSTVGSLSNNADESRVIGCDQGRAESYTGDKLSHSPEVNVASLEPAIRRLLDLQSQLSMRRMASPQERDELSTLINATMHSTGTLIDVVESLPRLVPSAKATPSTSPTSPWGPAPDAGTFTTGPPAHTAPELLDQYQNRRQQHPDFALAISLFMTNHLLLLDSYEELLVTLRARQQCSRQGRGPSDGSDFSLSQHFFNNSSCGHFNEFSLANPFNLDVNSVVFLLCRMMKRLQKSIEDRSALRPAASISDAHLKGHELPYSHAALNFDFQDGGSQDTDGASELPPTGGHSPMANLGDYASWEASKRHQSVNESLRVIRWPTYES